MKKEKSLIKVLGILFLCIMMLGTMLFTGCSLLGSSSDLEKKVAELEKRIEVLEGKHNNNNNNNNQISISNETAETVLANLITFSRNINATSTPATSTVSMGSLEMTNFSGIGSYQLNSVTFKESTNYSVMRRDVFMFVSMVCKMMQSDILNINEKFLVTNATTGSGIVAYDLRVVLSETQLEIYIDNYYPETGSQTHSKIRLLCKFDTQLNVKNIIIDGFQDSSVYMTCYFANSKIYDKNTLSASLEDKIESTIYSSFTAVGTKNTTPVDVTSIINAVEEEYNALPAI